MINQEEPKGEYKTPVTVYNLKDKVWAYMNKDGGNTKEVNWVKPLKRIDKEHVLFQIGYWITYINCKPIYKKEELVIDMTKL